MGKLRGGRLRVGLTFLMIVGKNVTNIEIYNQAFMEGFSIDADVLGDTLEHNSIEEWDSIGHMNLIGLLEDAFDIAMDMDDIIDFSSYNKGKELLDKYGVKF